MANNLITERSVLGAAWTLADALMDQVDLYMRRYELPEIVARILCSRGIVFENVQSFLNPTFKNDFPDPFRLIDMGNMAEDVAVAIEACQKFAIFGDFDVDGATSSAVMFRFLKSCGIDAPVYIPDRLTEGYGPNIDALRQIKAQGTDILMMLDCGTTAFDVIAAGFEMGLKIIILDHHEAEEQLPRAWYIINPKRKDDKSDLSMMAAVGVTFMSCVAINSRLRDRGFYAARKKKEINLKSLIDLVALGTVCDMVPLHGVNRLFVRYGLQESVNIGISALMQTAKINLPLSTFDCGYVLGPRINAGGRIDKAELGAKLLCSDNEEECKNIAWTLHDCNEKRKVLQQEMEEKAIFLVQQNGLENNHVILVADEAWHPGLSGLVAGRLKEQFKKPTCVIAFAENKDGILEGRGSGRSVAGIHIAQAFIDARHVGLLEKGGGHAMAGGFTVRPDNIQDLQLFLNDHIARQMQNVIPSSNIIVDCVLSVRGVDVMLVEMVQQKLGPFGQDYPEPLFMFSNVRIYSFDTLGENHIRVMIGDEEGGTRIKAMAFRAVGTSLGKALSGAKNEIFNIVGTLKINEWQGRKTAEIHIVDAGFSGHQIAEVVATK